MLGVATHCAVIANVVGFVMIAVDKWRARQGKWRTSELALLGPSLIGGWAGTLWAMKIFRHKTQKRSFQLKLGLATAISLVLAYFGSRRVEADRACLSLGFFRTSPRPS